MIELHVKHHGELADPALANMHELLQDLDNTPEVVFVSTEKWQQNRPRTLVVACSDGRLQESTDEFLERQMGVIDYDRLYAPGGPGALSTASRDVRTDQLRRDLKLLLEAHKIEEIVLLFHGVDRTGPEHAVCAHYKRILPGAFRQQIVKQQHSDAAEAMTLISGLAPRVKLHVLRAEVTGTSAVHFVNLMRGHKS